MAEPLSPAQLRAARALLAWSQQDLAREAHVAASTVADFERGYRTPVANNADAMRGALEDAGISLLSGGAVVGPPPVIRRATPAGGIPIRWVDATDLSQWAERRDAQGSMPELLTKLIRAATGSAAKIEFPSDESVQFAGWDGTCDIEAGTEHIPDGRSGWEIGTQRNKITEKADEDYTKRTADLLGLNKAESSFVFVTPRRWAQKRKWAEAKRAEKDWLDVRAYDADDLVHWIELYPAVGHWLAVALGNRPVGVQQLAEAWEEWSLSTQLPLSTDLILAGRDEEATKILRWLRDDPSVLSIQAEAPDEAIAFLHAAIGELPEPNRTAHYARSLIASDVEAARKLGDSLSPLIIVLEDAEPGLAQRLASRGHHVIIAHGPSGGARQALKLSRPPRDAIEHALVGMGLDRETHARTLARDAARSLAVLRRLMPSALPRVPTWARGNPSRCLVAALLAGAWDEDSAGDKMTLERLAGQPYETVVAELAPLVGHLEQPLRKVGTVWKVASPRDAWFRLASRISSADFERFGAVAHDVLASNDPRFEMAPDERWLAGLKGIKPEYSRYLRRGIGETLILFSLYPGHVPSVVSAEAGVENLVRKLLENADQQRWWSLIREFQLLAEAAPGTFLSVLDGALHEGKNVDVLFANEGDPLFGGGTNLAELLWALESLAWSPQYVGRVVAILAKLAARDPDPSSRGGNRPAPSLRNIFLLWYPQTFAPLSARLRMLDQVRKREPDVAWKLMLGILPHGHDSAMPASHTRWRDLSADQQEPVTYALIAKGAQEIATRLLADVGIRADRWHEVIKAFANLPPEHRKSAIEQLTAAAGDIRDDDARAEIGGALRALLSHHREFPDADWALPEEELVPVEALYRVVQPRDLIKRSTWLFSHSVHLPVPIAKMVEGQHVNHSWELDQQETANQRRAVIMEILDARGADGVWALAQSVERPDLVGRALAEVPDREAATDAIFVRALTGLDTVSEAVAGGLVVGFLIRGGDAWVGRALSRAAGEQWGDEATFRILQRLPETQATWSRVAALGEAIDNLYWSRIHAWIRPEEGGDPVYAVERLLKAGRARHALHLIGHRHNKVLPVELVIRLLNQAVQEPWKEGERNDAIMFQHDVVEIFKSLDKREVSDEQLAALEWAYLPVFEYSDRPPPALQKALATQPRFFVEVIRKVYRPSKESGIEEPPPDDLEREEAIIRQAYDLLRTWRRLPGTTDDGILEPASLEAWVREARIQAAQVGREAMADYCIGQVLAHAPRDPEGIWPAVPVRDLIEITRSHDLEQGLHVGVHNSRGVTTRAPNDGGALERDLAQYYRRCSEETALEWPRTSALLEQLAKSYEQEGVRHDQDAERRDW
jgi:transcriptional regulator with XRE-family HTH domain